MTDSLGRAVKVFAAGLEPLATSIGRDEDSIIAFVETLGWTLPSVPPALKALSASLSTISELNTTIELRSSVHASGGSLDVDVADYVKLATAVFDLVTQLDGLSGSLGAQLPANFAAATDFVPQFVTRLFDRAVVNVLMSATKRAEGILRVAGVLEVVEEPAVPAAFQPAFIRYTIHWDRFGQLLSDPAALLRAAYGWGTPAFDARVIFDSIMHLSFALGGPADLDWPSPARVQALTGVLPPVDAVGPPNLIVPFIDHDVVEAGVTVLPLPGGAGLMPGIALGVFIDASLPPTLDLSGRISLRVDAQAELAASASIVLRPGIAPQVRLGLEGPSGPSPAAPKVGMTLIIGGSTPMTVFEAGGSKLDIGSIELGAGVGAHAKGVEPYVDVAINKGVLTLGIGASDGFLAKILPSGPIQTNFDLGVSWSSSGLRFTGSGALSVAIPLHVTLGPFDLENLYLVGSFSADAIVLETSVSGGAHLGPLQAVVDHIGLLTTVAMRRGNLGPVDLAIGFKAPTAVGLSVDAGVVKGGGFLSVDTARGEYEGALELALFEIVTIKAICIVNTKFPDGTPGFSLLIIMSVEFGTGIQLGFGFTLLGLGGLLGLNRSMRLDAIAEGVRTGSLDSIMFPKDVIANAPKIISDLRTYFPPKDGVFLIGPMVKLGWGTPTLASVSLGIIIEIPGNVAIVGIIKVAIPADDVALILLQVSFIGAMEFDRKRIWFFASLFGSRVVFLTIDGEMGLLMAYGDDANFVLTVGGFHPRFAPPPLPFPSPRRISISLLNTPVSRMTVEGYFAVTTNTVQFGARVDMMWGLDELNVRGSLSFDALFQFSPFRFEIEISASLSVNVFGAGLFSVRVNGELDGPSPWHVKGHGSISLLFWDIDVDFETTWGESQNSELPPVAVMPIVLAELDKVENWRAILPANAKLSVTVRTMDADEAALMLHPAGFLRVSERAIPLDLQLDKIGGQKPNDVRRLTLAVTGAGLQRQGDALERFAEAQFRNLSDADKLSQPAFTFEHSGVDVAAADALGTSSMVCRVVRYEEIIIDSNYKRFARKWRSLIFSLFDLHILGAAVAKCALSKAIKTQREPFEEKISVQTAGFVVALQANNTALAGATAVYSSAAAAHDFLAASVTADGSLAGTLHVIPQFEMAS
jgi:hypothetical protein